MSIRRIVQIVAFLSALALSFSATLASTADACDPQGITGGLC